MAVRRARGLVLARAFFLQLQAQLAQEMAHGRQHEAVFGTKIMVRQSRGDPRPLGNLAHGDIQRPAVVNRRNHRVHQRATAFCADIGSSHPCFSCFLCFLACFGVFSGF